MTIGILRAFGTMVAFSALLGVSACNPGQEAGGGLGSDSESGQDVSAGGDNSSETVPCDAPFEGLEDAVVWMLATDPTGPADATLNIVRTENELVVSILTRTGGCSGTLSQTPADVVGGVIHLAGAIEPGGGGDLLPLGPGEEHSSGCSIEMTGTIAACGNASSFLPGVGMTVFRVEVEGQMVIDGQQIAIGDLDLTVFRGPETVACQAPPVSLEELDWSLSSSNPNSIEIVGLPDVSINVDGHSEAFRFASITGSPDVGIDCFAEAPMGTIHFDGQHLSIDVELDRSIILPPGSDGLPPLPPPDVEGLDICSLTFEGQVTECLEPAQPGSLFGGLSAQVLTIEGTGTYGSGNEQRELTTLYLTLGASAAGPIPVP